MENKKIIITTHTVEKIKMKIQAKIERPKSDNLYYIETESAVIKNEESENDKEIELYVNRCIKG